MRPRAREPPFGRRVSPIRRMAGRLEVAPRPAARELEEVPSHELAYLPGRALVKFQQYPCKIGILRLVAEKWNIERTIRLEAMWIGWP